jgi:diguanylate cyclase (GGDEF)-like protein
MTFKELWETIKAKKVWKGLVKNRAKDGSAYVVSATIMPILSEDGRILEYIAIRQDITEVLQQQAIITRQTTDSLTKLANREKLLEALEASQYPNLALINIDNFREINEFYGFAIGDSVLIQIAQLIKNILVNHQYNIYKLPADEFAVLVDSEEEIHSFQQVVIDLIDQLQATLIVVDKHPINITLTMGISHSKTNVLNNADIALRNARKLKKHYYIYDEESKRKEIIKENLRWHNIIKEAIQDKRIVPHFQPIYNMKTDKIEKYESLVRLIDHNGDIISPYFFLDIAKRYLQYKYITKIMIKRTFHHFRDKSYEFSINLSIDDIIDEEMVEYILNEIQLFPNPQQIIFEITESEGIENYSQIETFLYEIKKLGCKIAIDDFGTGYSNFEHIIKLKVDYIKIDGSLIKNIITNLESKIVVEAIVVFSKKLGISTIAEFVSCEDIYNIIKELDADFVQGYYIGKAESNTE